MRRFSRITADLLLLATALAWGGSFVIVRDTVRDLSPFLLIGGRFLVALLALAAVFPRHLRDWRPHARPALVLAGLLMGGFALQTYGLRYTSASSSGFITGLNVVFVAMIAAALHRSRLPWRSVLSAALATLGLLLLAWQPDGWRFGPGDLLTLGCALFYALHIVVTGRLAPNRDPVTLTAVQFAAMAFGGFALHLLTGGAIAVPRAANWLALAYLGLPATAFAFLMQTAAQRHTPAVDAAVIFATEPLSAAAIAVLLGGEHLTTPMLLGGGAIFAATLLSVLGGGRRPPGRSSRGCMLHGVGATCEGPAESGFR